MKRTTSPDFAEQRKNAADAKKALLEKLKGNQKAAAEKSGTDSKKTS